MSTVTVRDGDTFESISRASFGTEDKASSIKAANPGASNPPNAGSTLIIPKVSTPLAPENVEAGETSVLIDGTRFVGWTEVSFTRVMDSFGSFSLQSVWEPENKAVRELFKPYEFQSVAIFEGEDLLFNGTMMPPTPAQSANGRTISAAGYSLPGVINDCNAPVSALPLESDAQNLQQVAVALLEPFGIPVEFDGDAGAAFQREAIKPTDKILQYLINLSQQRKLIITDTPAGGCKFQTEVATGSPVAVISEGQAGIDSIEPRFNAQDYFSHISGQSFTALEGVDAPAGSTFTVLNPRLTTVLRPFTFKPTDVAGGDLKAAVEAKAGRMFASAISYLVTIPSWRDPQGDLWVPNKTIMVQAPGVMIYESFEFLIRSVNYRRTHDAESVVLELVLPGVFRGETPEAFPWD